jgi:hypothetical protein
MPPPPPGNTEGDQCSGMEGVPPGCMYIHTPVRDTQFVNLNAYAKDHKCKVHCAPDSLTDDGTSSGWYTICYVVIHLASVLQITAADRVNLTVKLGIDRTEQKF